MEISNTKKNIANTVLRFFIQNEEFAIHVQYVQTILEVPKITRIPGSPDYISGIITHRNQVLVVVDGNYKLNYSPSKVTSDSCLLVLELNNCEFIYKIALLVDSVNAVDEVLVENILPPPVGVISGCKNLYKGVIEDASSLVQFIDPNYLLDECELSHLNSIDF